MRSRYVRTNVLFVTTMACPTGSRISKTSSLFGLATLVVVSMRIWSDRWAALERVEDKAKESADESAEMWRMYVSLVVFVSLFASLTDIM